MAFEFKNSKEVKYYLHAKDVTKRLLSAALVLIVFQFQSPGQNIKFLKDLSGLTGIAANNGIESPVTISVVYDNYIKVEGFKSDWGYSIVIKGLDKEILFDTGTNPDIFKSNFIKMEPDPGKIDFIVLSHEHSDHTGGIPEFVKMKKNIPVIIPQSFSDSFKKQLVGFGLEPLLVKDPVKICENLYSSGEFAFRIPEQALVLNTKQGLVVMTGCSHPGIVEMLKEIKSAFNKNIFMVFGGFHLLEKSEKEMNSIITEMKALGVVKCGATHCTGDAQIKMIKEAFGTNYFELGVGNTITIATAQQNKAEQMYQQALYEMDGKGDYAKAIESLNQVMTQFPKEKTTAAKALLNIGRCYEKLGKNEAQKAYERILKEFKDQLQVVAEARTRLAALKQPVDVGARQPKPSNRQIWAGPDVDTEGAPSPDGRYLSYTDKTNSLAIYDLKTGERTILANPDAKRKDMFVNESVWSPDGKQLAYGLCDEDHQAEIHLVNVDGTGHRTLCAVDTGDSYVWAEDWSRDGKMILAVFQHFDDRGPKIALVSVGDGSVRFVKTVINWDWRLSHKLFFSPDGRFIAYSSPTEKKGKTCDVFVIAVDGSSEMNITQHPADDRVLGWEPNGSRLLFASDRGGSYNLWATQMVNGQPQEYPKLIKNNIGKISPMGWTNDGSLYYSVKSAEGTSILKLEIPRKVSGRINVEHRSSSSHKISGAPSYPLR